MEHLDSETIALCDLGLKEGIGGSGWATLHRANLPAQCFFEQRRVFVIDGCRCGLFADDAVNGRRRR